MTIERMLKQHHPDLLDPINTDGCLFRCETGLAELYCDNALSAAEINTLFWYVTPWYMMDGLKDRDNRCFVLHHTPIVEAALKIMGKRNAKAFFLARQDRKDGKWEWISGDRTSFNKADFYITRIRLSPARKHFYISDKYGKEIWNPGNSINYEIDSIRGFSIREMQYG
jgi:hypothetical protein